MASRPAATIEVQQSEPGLFLVRVIEGRSDSRYRVTLDPGTYERLTSGRSGPSVSPEDLIRWSFEFLLEREPQESILPQFELSVISRYFPNFEGDIKRRLQFATGP